MIPIPVQRPQRPVPPKPETSADQYFKFSHFQAEFDKMIVSFTDVERRAIDSRRLRRARVDVEALRSRGLLNANETYISVRVIDENIARAMPARLAYLKSANRLAIFEPQNRRETELNTNIQELENEFWRVSTYPGWEDAYIKLIDGSELLGYAWVETRYDPDKPGNFAVEAVAQDALLFDRRVTDIQDSQIIARVYALTAVNLRRLAKANNFDQSVVNDLLAKIKETASSGITDVDTTRGQSTVKIYHYYLKDDNGVVSHGWYAKDAKKWLKQPSLFYVGVDKEVTTLEVVAGQLEPVPTTKWEPVAETQYPFTPLYYKVTEADDISKVTGRADDEYYQQDAACSLWSAYVNGCVTASNTMWAPAGDTYDTAAAAPKQLDFTIRHNAIWDRKMESFNSPWPDPSMPRSLEMLDTRNADANANVAYAVNNRVDSRKTATEVAAAQKENAQLSGATVLNFSICLRAVFESCWRIIQSQALQNLIVFCPLPDGTNNAALIKADYTIKPAGDVDYIERANRLQSMQQDWPMIAQTPIASLFAQDYLRLRYPDRALAYIAEINSGQAQQMQQGKQLVANLAQILQHAVTDEHGQLRPEFAGSASQLQQLAQQVQAYVAPKPPVGNQAAVG